MAKDKDSKNRYLTPEFVEFWLSDKSMEEGRRLWRSRMLSYLPFESDEKINVLDLGAGTGALSIEILERYPNVRLTCLDFSEVMLSHAKEQLKAFKEKITFVQGNLQERGWSKNLGAFDAVVSSFVTHTIPNHIKALYEELYGTIKPSGCFLSCDIIPPPGPTLRTIYHKAHMADHQYKVKMETGTEKPIQEIELQFHKRRENYRAFLKDKDRDTTGSPSIVEHLCWLREAGFDEMDCLEKHARNAIIGAFKHA